MADETGLPAKVGYKRPPVEHRFKKGQSGNPKGRPRKSAASEAATAGSFGLAADEVLLGEAYRPVRMREGDQVKTMSTLAAVYRSTATAAMKGDRFAREHFTRSVHQAEVRRQAERHETIEAIVIYKDGCYAEFDAADARGAPRPKFVPHPDDLVIDADGMPHIVGPFDEVVNAAWDKLRRRVQDGKEEIVEARRMAARHPESARSCYDDIVREERFTRYIDFALPDETTRRRPGYEKPTIEAVRAYRAELARRYRPFAELSADEQERALRELVPERHRQRKMLASWESTER